MSERNPSQIKESIHTDSTEYTVALPVMNTEHIDIIPVDAGYENCKPSHFFGPSYRDYYLIHYVFEGSGFFEILGKTFPIKKGDMFLIKPYEITKYYANNYDPWKYCWLGFISEKAEFLLGHTPFANNMRIINEPLVEPLFKSLQTSINAGISLNLFLCAKIYELFSILSVSNNDIINEHVFQAINYMKKNYSSNITVNKIAERFNIDRRYLCRLFNKYVGQSPLEFLINIRLQSAVDLLLHTDYTISQIAKSVGYDDALNFTKIFKKKMNYTPKEYRAKYQNNVAEIQISF